MGWFNWKTITTGILTAAIVTAVVVGTGGLGLTALPLAGACLGIGIGSGTVIGATIGCIDAACNGKNISDGIIEGAISGAAVGAAVGAAAGAGFGIAASTSGKVVTVGFKVLNYVTIAAEAADVGATVITAGSALLGLAAFGGVATAVEYFTSSTSSNNKENNKDNNKDNNKNNNKDKSSDNKPMQAPVISQQSDNASNASNTSNPSCKENKKENKKDWLSLISEGNSKYYSNHILEALELYSEAAALNKSDYAYYFKGRALMALGRYQAAIDAFDIYLKGKHGRYENALREAKDSIVLAYVKLAESSILNGKFQEAIEFANKALIIDANNQAAKEHVAVSYVKLAMIAYDNNDTKEALDILSKAMNVDSKNFSGVQKLIDNINTTKETSQAICKEEEKISKLKEDMQQIVSQQIQNHNKMSDVYERQFDCKNDFQTRNALMMINKMELNHKSRMHILESRSVQTAIQAN
jgi:tetratricopeptide (TPR) repeat protein